MAEQTTDAFPVNWNVWREQWADWRADFERRAFVRRRSASDGPSPFIGRNIMADEILGVWMVGAPGTDGSRVRAVEMSEVTFTIGETRRYVGLTIDESGPGGETALVGSFAELDEILARLANGDPLP